jgi:hypothetical protein
MSRIDDLTARMVVTMPLPAPESGPRFSRVRLWAKAVVDEEAQTGNAVEQMKMPVTLTRTDTVWNGSAWVAVNATIPASWDEANSATWRFSAADDVPGAAGVFLNQWGRNLQVPRYEGELDQSYARRMAEEVISPSTTNMGLAALIDRILGMTGTRVLEGEGFFGSIRLNDGRRLNSGKRLMGFGAFGAESLWNTFIVVLPSPLPDTASEQAVIALIDRRRGAGNRLLAIVSDGLAPQVTAPDAVPVNQPYTARVIYPEGGASYAWTVTNGSITAGQGTTQITVQPAAEGLVQAVVTQTGGLGNGKQGSRNTTAVAAIVGTITVDVTEAPAGETGHVASIPARDGAIYTWTALNGYIVNGQGTNQITFGLGEADQILGARVHLICVVSLPNTAITVQGEAFVDILPYPRQITITTASLAAGASQTGVVPMGKFIEVTNLMTSASARVRLYRTAAQRDADIGRPIGTLLTGDPAIHGQIAEGLTSSSLLSFQFIPEAEGPNGDTPISKAIYYTITNTDVVPNVISSTITFIQAE